MTIELKWGIDLNRLHIKILFNENKSFQAGPYSAPFAQVSHRHSGS